jgi:hypothetical protein
VALVTIDPATKKSKVDHLVISFSRSDDLKHFEKIWEEAIDSLKKQQSEKPKESEKKE